MPLTYLITGATGLIGSHLIRQILNRGENYIVLSSDKDSAGRKLTRYSKLLSYPEIHDLINDKIDVIINLAGYNIGEGRWTAKRKKLIYDSRIKTTASIIELISVMKEKPQLLISASGVDYYISSDSKVTEDSPNADTFLGKVCRDWENEALKAEGFGVRTVIMRTGFVIARNSKALKRLITPYKLFLGGTIGSGNQYFSWIHIDDLIRLYFFVSEMPQITGPVNAVSPSAVTMRKLSATIGEILSRPSFMRIPGFIIKTAMGESSQLILSSRNVEPAKAVQNGFRFKYENIYDALSESLRT